jgi:hypothetical protein
MSVAELISILDGTGLIFRQFRSLRRDDRAEGAIPKDLYAGDRILKGDSRARLKGLSANADLRYCTYVQCWHRATREHSAFWKIYGDRGVALRTKISALKAERFWQTLSLTGDDIVYADTWTEAENKGLAVPEGITPNRASMRRKRRAFSWEKEWRIFYKPPTARYGALDARLPPNEYEIARKEWRAKWPEYEKLAIDSLKWISHIVVAPGSPTWVLESICSIAERHDVPCALSKI